jgi:carnitine 3-dehydrogenase
MRISLPQPKQVATIGILGAGVIGGGWAIHFLRRGLDVVVWDPGKDARPKLERMLERAWPIMVELGLAPGADPSRLRWASSQHALAQSVEVIQENAPENLALKQALYHELGRIVPPDVPILSSTSGFPMTDIQADCATPARTVVGHPFNPPYLIPFLEVVGGQRTDAAAVDWAVAFYTLHDKKPVKMTKELPGFLGNRLQDAIWREALHMVAADEASVEDIDTSIAYGPGLRWAIMGPCLTYHLGGGEGGMAHLLDHFGPALKEPWTRLAAPDLTPELRRRMVDGCERQAAGRSVADLARERDICLLRIIKALEEFRGAVAQQRAPEAAD